MTDHYQDIGYATLDPCNGEAGRKLADKIMSIIRTFKDVSSICDLGCGNGYIAARLAALGYHVTGVDASKSGIELAQKNYHADNLEFICAGIDSSLLTALSPKKFDLVLSSDVIEHLYRPADLMETATSLLRPGGHLVIGTPYHGYLKNLALSFLNRWDAHHTVAWDGGHIKFFSVSTLRNLIRHYGYSDISFSYYGRVPLLWKNMICRARKSS